jgi:hypothetical protein
VPLLVAPVPPPCEPPPRKQQRSVHPVERLSLDAAPPEAGEASVCVLFEKSCLFPAVPKCVSRPVLHFSLVAQMDGVLYKELKVRPEVDVLAVSSSVAVTRCWGVPRDGVGHPLPS